MENLFIEVRNGEPVNHPMTGDNIKMIHPNITLPNSDYMAFERVQAPALGPYQVNEGVTYEIIGDVVKDVWHIRDMTPSEKEEKINFCKEHNKSPFASWVWDEATCSYISPVPPPEKTREDMFIYWNEAELQWKEIPPSPGKDYIFDPSTGVWIKP